MAFTDADVQEALKQLIDPNTKKDFVSGKSIKNIKIAGNDISLDVMLGYPAKSVWNEIKTLVEAHLRKAIPGFIGNGAHHGNILSGGDQENF